MMLKKVMALLLAVVMVFTLATACGSKQDAQGEKTQEGSQKAQEGNSTDNAGSGESTLPITKDPLTLSCWTALNANAAAVVKDYSEIEAMKVIKEKTGIDVKWMHPPVGQEKEQFNLMISTSDLPDVIEYNWPTDYSGGPQKAIQDGVLIPLNDLIDQYAPNFKKILEENPEVKKQISTDNGDIYCFPYLYLDPKLEGPFQGFQIREDWLKKLGLEMPSTIDDWYNVLTAFKKNDPNENGESDEIPFGAQKTPEFYWFMTAWGMTPQYTGWYRVNNEIKFVYLQPEYEEYLRTMAKWYKEGLIDPDFAITDAKGFDSKVTTNKTGSYFGYPGSRLGRYMTLMEKENPGIKLAGVPYPVLKTGDKPIVGHKNNMFTGLGAGLTPANKHLAETVKWLDYRYGEEGHMLLEYGIEGKSYTMKDGEPVYTEEITKNPEGLAMALAMAKYCTGSFNVARVHDFESEKQQQARPEQVDALNAWFIESKDRNLPPLILSPEDSQEYSNIMNEVTTFVTETEAKVIMGAQPIESFDFAQYTKTLKDMGIDQAIKTQQDALDRYNKR